MWGMSRYCCAGLGGLLLTLADAVAGPAPQMSPAQSHYLEGCGGCHGIQGTSSKQDIPQLRGLVGRYLCTTAGREYLVRLPNVAFADMDDELLAQVMNFVVFRLGDGSAPANAVAYSPRGMSSDASSRPRMPTTSIGTATGRVCQPRKPRSPPP